MGDIADYIIEQGLDDLAQHHAGRCGEIGPCQHCKEEHQPTNREKKRAPKQGKFWCWKCDGYLVHEGARCPNCGHKTTKRNRR